MLIHLPVYIRTRSNEDTRSQDQEDTPGVKDIFHRHTDTQTRAMFDKSDEHTTVIETKGGDKGDSVGGF